jgi:hypothetical protein
MFNDSADTVLNETFEYEFGGKGASKAGAVGPASKTLPAPSLDDAWKPLTSAKTKTAFFKMKENTLINDVAPAEESMLRKDKRVGRIKENEQPEKTAAIEPAEGTDPEMMRNQIAQQMRELTKKFEDLEARRQRDTKHEVLLFVGTGLFILVSLDIVARIARR